VGEGATGRIASRLARFRGRVRDLLRWIRDHYCVIDVRTAGLFRIVLGFLCATDTIRHWVEARWAYCNAGVLTNHYHLFRPSSGYNFSLFHAFSSIEEVHVAFALAVLCHLCFLVGWHARLFSVVSFVLMTSLDNRLVMVENGGYVVVNLLCAWAIFLPTERRFSVDAWLRSYRERKERSLCDLNDRTRPAWATAPYVSGIGVLIILNLAAVYIFNVVNKSGEIWRHGETVHYVLFLNRMVTGLAVLARELMPFWATRVVTWSVLAVESSLITWILSPYALRVTRPLAIAGMVLLHTSFGLMMRLGPFSWYLIGWSTLLLTKVQWDGLERWYRRRASPRVVVYDRASPLGFALCRVLARLDDLDLLRFEESDAAAASPPLLAVRDAEGAAFTGTRAVGEVLQALPGGRFLRPAVRVATLGLLGPLLAAVSARRAGVARFFGLTLPPQGRERRDEPTALLARLRAFRGKGREVLILYLGMCAFSQAINENVCFPNEINAAIPERITIPDARWLGPLRGRLAGLSFSLGRLGGRSIKIPVKWKQWKFVEATLGYPRMFQGWGMFAPNPITDDGSITVEAWTTGGRRVDPFTGQAPDLDLTDARGLGLSQIRQDYFNRIRLDRNKVFRQGLRDYLLGWHKETGHPEDELVAFDVYWVRDQCPRPGSKKPYANEKIALLTYRKPGYEAPPGVPAIPSEPKVESAGN
jgi:hypothetical protein